MLGIILWFKRYSDYANIYAEWILSFRVGSDRVNAPKGCLAQKSSLFARYVELCNCQLIFEGVGHQKPCCPLFISLGLDEGLILVKASRPEFGCSGRGRIEARRAGPKAPQSYCRLGGILDRV